jgi:hypothetical protein
VKPDYWVVIDNLQSDEKHDCDVLFHAAPGIKVNMTNDDSVEFLSPQNGARLYLIPEESAGFKISSVKGCEAPIQGWYSVDHHIKVPAPAVLFRVKGVRHVEKAILLYPCPAHQEQKPPSLKRLSVSGGKCSAFVVSSFAGIDYLMVSDNNKSKNFGPFQSNGVLAIVRTTKKGEILNRFESL